MDASIAYAESKDWPIGPRERFEGEGTEEVYIGNDGSSRLLLMAAIGPGPYQDAYEKRGAGIHHVGLKSDNPRGLVESFLNMGWAEHAKSQQLWDQCGAFWLYRSGMPLLEIGEADVFPELDFNLSFPFSDPAFERIQGIKNELVEGALMDCIGREKNYFLHKFFHH